MGEGILDELRQIDPGNAENENAQTSHCDGEGRRNAARRRRRKARVGDDRQAQIEPAGLLGLDDARSQSLLDRLCLCRHSRLSSGQRIKRVIDADMGRRRLLSV